MVEWIPFRIDPRHRVFLQDLDLGTEFLPQNRFAGVLFIPLPLVSIPLTITP